MSCWFLRLAPIFWMLASSAQAEAPPRLKQEAARLIDARSKQAQEMVDKVFSFAEPGFQEYATAAYLTSKLESHGFKVERGISGIPTALRASWGKSGPTNLLASDIAEVLGTYQMLSTSTSRPLVAGEPGPGEGQHCGRAVILIDAEASMLVVG